MTSHLIEMQGIVKTFRMGAQRIQVLKKINFRVHRGEFISIMGPSGSGKSTLLHLLGCLSSPTAGSYHLDGVNVLDASDRVLSNIRANHIGFVFQTFNLLNTLDVFENVELPFLYRSHSDKMARDRALKAIERVGLYHRINHKPAELSGGEMQRVAIARALCIEPKIVLADEPTGNLDSRTGQEILKLFQDLNQSGTTIIMVSHDSGVASYSQRILHLQDGYLT
jgi:ABC-type lipoprotein export system ATPase subunit